MRRIIFITAVSLLMSSCGVYNKYQPTTEVPDNIFGENISVVDTASLGQISWRELFTDTCLQALIDKGLANSTDLKVAHLRVKSAEAALMTAKSSYLPSLSLNADGGLSRYNNSSAKTYNIGVGASWELDVFGKVTNTKRGQQAALEGSKAYAQAVRTQLVATIANGYYTLLMLDSQISITERTLKTWEETVRTLEALKNAGKTTEASVLQARANCMSLETSKLSLVKSVSETENALCALLASPPHTIERSSMTSQHFPEELSVGVPLQLLSNRPDVRQAEFALAQAFYATNTARAAFYPSITLSGNAGWTNNGGGMIVNPGKWLLSAIGSLTQPLFNKGINIANLQIAKNNQEEAELMFQQSLLDAGKEVNDALIQWQTARQRIAIDQEQISTLQEAVRKTELLMRHTDTNYLEVLTAQQSLLAVELTDSQDRFDEIQGVISLYHALGGGQ